MNFPPRTIEEQSRILLGVAAVWAKYPHMRLGQLIDCATYKKCSTFYVRDEDLVRFLETLVTNNEDG